MAITDWKGWLFRRQLSAWITEIEASRVTGTGVTDIVQLSTLTDYTNTSPKDEGTIYVWKLPVAGMAIGTTTLI